MALVIVLAVGFAAAIIGNWAQYRAHQERLTPLPEVHAWSSVTTSDVLFHPERFTPEGRRWRRATLSAWATLFAVVIAFFIIAAGWDA